MGGSLILEQSALGEGSTFLLRLPLFKELGGKIETIQKASTRSENIFSDLKILVVDDSQDNQDLICKFLEQTGAQMTTASDGAQALEKVAHSDFDIILLDIQMPKVDGYQTIKKLREGGKKMPIIALTAHALKEERLKAIRFGFNTYVTKPIDRNLLIQSIGQLTNIVQNKPKF